MLSIVFVVSAGKLGLRSVVKHQHAPALCHSTETPSLRQMLNRSTPLRRKNGSAANSNNYIWNIIKLIK